MLNNTAMCTCNVIYFQAFGSFPFISIRFGLTCKVGETQTFQAMVAVKVMKYRKGPFFFIQTAPANHSELVQRKPAELVHSNEDVACDLSNTLKEIKQSMISNSSADVLQYSTV